MASKSFLILKLLLPLVVACSQPTPKPTVLDGGVDDPVFRYGSIYNCLLPVVAVERDSALGDVRGCLLLGEKTAVATCLDKKTLQYQPASVACVARDVGGQANAACLAHSTDPADKTVADAAREWVLDRHLGFISVEVGQ